MTVDYTWCLVYSSRTVSQRGTSLQRRVLPRATSHELRGTRQYESIVDTDVLVSIYFIQLLINTACALPGSVLLCA